MKASKLKPGDEIRIIAPSRSLSLIAADQIEIAKRKLEYLGFIVSISKNALESDEFVSSSINARVEDLHNAFLDSNVKGILTAIGGYNCNQLLKYIDYSLVASNPKRLCGYSDITALSNAIYKKTGLTTYSGPHFSTFGMIHGNEYTEQYFEKIMIQDELIFIQPAKEWSDDLWYLDQENRTFIRNEGPYAINHGDAEGTIIGGNLGTLNLLQGTEFIPDLANTILFIEDDLESSPLTFDRDLQSLIHQPGFNEVRGVVIGRFQKASAVNKQLLTRIIKSKKELDHIPVIADADFGHTSPLCTLPIGGYSYIKADENHIEIIIED